MSDVFNRAINSVSRSISNKRDFIQHFRQQYGEKNWKREAAIYMSGTSNAKSKEYRSASRNFQGARLQQEGATAKWKGFGKDLPRIMTKDTLTLVINAKQHDNRGGGKMRDRTIRVNMTPAQTRDFVNAPTWGKVWNAYGFSFPVQGSDAEDWGEDQEDFDYNDYDVDIDYELSDVSVSAA